MSRHKKTLCFNYISKASLMQFIWIKNSIFPKENKLNRLDQFLLPYCAINFILIEFIQITKDY